MSLVSCPECCGKGVLLGYGCPGFKPIQLPCPMCNGKKVVSQHVIAWVASGEKMRQDRIKRGKTLRVEAKERGMGPVDLSEMERGIVEPKPRNLMTPEAYMEVQPMKTLVCGCIYDIPSEFQKRGCCVAHRNVDIHLLEKLHDGSQALRDIEELLRSAGNGLRTPEVNVDKAWSIAQQYGKRV